jgi:protein tyrosine/serine phosphatase
MDYVKGKSMKQIIVVLVCSLIVTGILILLDCTAADKSSKTSIKTEEVKDKTEEAVIPARNEKWAQPLERPGVSNLFKVSDDLYRGAQPSAEGMKELKKMGIKTIINLRSFHSDRDEIGETGLAYEHIYMKAWHAEDKEVVRFLQIVSNPNRTPVFVHCMHGSDRTGTMCALYRIAIQGWSKEDALEEMTKGGYGFHGVWKNLPKYIEELDMDDIKKRAGL